jgi:peptide-methionine (S)-S-oxide reductase
MAPLKQGEAGNRVCVDPDYFSIVLAVVGLISCVESGLSLYERLASRGLGWRIEAAQKLSTKIADILPHVEVDLEILQEIIRRSEIPGGRKIHLGKEAFIDVDSFRRYESTVSQLVDNLHRLTKLTHRLERTLSYTQAAPTGQLSDVQGRLQRILRDPDETIDQAVQDLRGHLTSFKRSLESLAPKGSSSMNRYRILRLGAWLLLPLLATLVAQVAMAQTIASANSSPGQAAGNEQIAVLAGGCFWGVDGVFKHVKGVTNVISGYSGGSEKTAEYEVVSTGTTGQAESVEITYDPSKISYRQLLKIFFFVAHDPTELNRQGPDTGTQYRSVIFYANQDQKKVADKYIAELNQDKKFPGPIVTEVVPLHHFYPAEEYHQNFLERNPDNPYIVENDLPKLEQLRKQFPNLYKSS